MAKANNCINEMV